MLIEHLAFMVPDPEAATKWYSENLGLREIRRGGGGDIFVSDDSGQVVIQLEDARLLEGKAEGHGNQHPSDSNDLERGVSRWRYGPCVGSRHAVGDQRFG